MATPSEFDVTYSLSAELSLRVSASDGDEARDMGDDVLSNNVLRGTLENGQAFVLVLTSGERVACTEASEG